MGPVFDPAALAADFDEARLIEDPQALRQLVLDIKLDDALTATGYGAKEQRALGEVSQTLLDRAGHPAMENALLAIEELRQQIQQINIPGLEEAGAFAFGLFSRSKRHLSALRRDFALHSQLVDRLASQLDLARLSLLKEAGVLNTLYQKNLENWQALGLRILAGQAALLKHKQRQAQGQDAGEFAELFKQRLHQLGLSKKVAQQTAVQIRLVEHSINLVVFRLQQTLTLALPLWQNQLALALNLDNQQKALGRYREAAREATTAMDLARAARQEGSLDLEQKNQGLLSSLMRLKQADAQLRALIDDSTEAARQARQISNKG